MQKGIDVSKWQGTINWQSVAADGVEFAMIRLGYGTKNGGAPDPKFRQNVEGALAAGIDAGVYFYGTAVTEEAARAEAHFVLTALELWRGRLAYPVAYDAEDSAKETLTKNKLTAVIAAFCDTVRAAGWYPMVYSSRYWLENKIYPAQIRADVWLAQWAQEATYAGEYGLWQCSDSAAVRGIAGNVDLDIAYEDYPARIRDGGYNGFGKRDPLAEIPEWARESVRWAVENGILQGGTEGLMPDAVCTRQEMCVFLKRLYDLTQI